VNRTRTALLSALVVLTVFGWRGCRGLEPLEPSEFADAEFVLLSDGTPVPQLLELIAGQGVFVELRVQPRDLRPVVYSDRDVQSPERWAVAWNYSRSNDPRGTDVVACEFARYRIPGRRHQWLRSPGGRTGWHEAGFVDEPPAPDGIKPDELKYWSFLAPPDSKWRGDIHYTVWAYPTAHQPSAGGTFKYGRPTGLFRGVLRVVDP